MPRERFRASRGLFITLRGCLVAVMLCWHTTPCSVRSVPAIGLIECWLQVICLSSILYLATVRLPPSTRPTWHYRRSLHVGLDQAKFCDEHFGDAWLAGWNRTAKAMCKPKTSSGSSQLTCRCTPYRSTIAGLPELQWPATEKLFLCRTMNDEHMTNASRPHVLCDAQNLLIDAKHMMSAPCLKHRPKYLCNFGTTYNRYLPGSFGLACTTIIAKLDAFPKDHLQDIMDSMVTLTSEATFQVKPCDSTAYFTQ